MLASSFYRGKESPIKSYLFAWLLLNLVIPLLSMTRKDLLNWQSFILKILRAQIWSNFFCNLIYLLLMCVMTQGFEKQRILEISLSLSLKLVETNKHNRFKLVYLLLKLLLILPIATTSVERVFSAANHMETSL